MAENRFTVGKTVTQVDENLTAGSKYLLQNTGSRDIRFTKKDTDPTDDDDISWGRVGVNEWFEIPEVDDAEPVWVRTDGGVSKLEIFDG